MALVAGTAGVPIVPLQEGGDRLAGRDIPHVTQFWAKTLHVAGAESDAVGGTLSGGRAGPVLLLIGASCVGPEDARCLGVVEDGVDGAGAVVRPGVDPANGLCDHLSTADAGDVVIHGVAKLGLGAPGVEVHSGAGSHVVGDLGAGRAV